MRPTCMFGTLLILSALPSTAEALVQLKADVIYVQNGNTTSALFRCTAGESHMYYLNHIITWSKIGRDGRETYLSLNWDLVDSELSSQYVISSQVFNEWPNNGTTANLGMYFVLGKTELTPADHGEYICRLYDFDRNVLAQQTVPIIVFERGLALSPYRIVGEADRDIAVNCMLNTSISNSSHIVLHHVTKDGMSKMVVNDGKIVDVKLKQKYGFATRDNGDGILHNVLTLKAPSRSDDGHIVCEMRNASASITETNATVTIAEPKLKVSPLYFLKVPDDAVAHFKCECEILDTAACINNDMVWSVIDSTTGEKTIIYKNEKLHDKSGAYDVIVGQNGSAVNLTVNGLKKGFSQGRDYVCSLHDKTTGNEITFASIPVSVSSISLGALALLNKYPAEIRLLCTMRGSVWDSHYFDDHHLSWVHVQNGASKTVTLSGALQKGYSPQKYTVTFDSQRYYSILVIQDVQKTDYGDYVCQLTNSHSGKLLYSKSLKVYGKDNASVFA